MASAEERTIHLSSMASRGSVKLRIDYHATVQAQFVSVGTTFEILLLLPLISMTSDTRDNGLPHRFAAGEAKTAEDMSKAKNRPSSRRHCS